ncbi:hypothetical protein [Kitasatospora sp. MAP5-34]|uniref:hypothetical protein n=1 Tax=Kitasatospora sp. MAP5-34 TaxID=3035102 RepID=UPI002475C376|nr:hypothetical protein [Kitasatospora sp. MAP5-34]
MALRSRAACALSALLLLALVFGAAALAWFSWPSACSDPREDCGASDSYSGDHTFPQVLARFSVDAPCGTRGLRYAYADDWNDSEENFGLHATVTPDCLRAFVAQIAPGADLDAAPLIHPDAAEFPFRLKFGKFPNGPLVLPDRGHAYRVVTATSPGSGRQVYLSIDTNTPSPTIEATFAWAAPDGWPH